MNSKTCKNYTPSWRHFQQTETLKHTMEFASKFILSFLCLRLGVELIDIWFPNNSQTLPKYTLGIIGGKLN